MGIPLGVPSSERKPTFFSRRHLFKIPSMGFRVNLGPGPSSQGKSLGFGQIRSRIEAPIGCNNNHIRSHIRADIQYFIENHLQVHLV